MSEQTVDRDRVRDEHAASIDQRAHWLYLVAVLGGGFLLMLLMIAVLGGSPA